MNPGPAPRPPTDRPRLALTPTTAGLPGNVAHPSIAQPMQKTPTSTYTGSVVPLPIARAQSNVDQGGVAIIKEGWATVKEGKTFLKAWNSKYLVLRKERLDFHKQENSRVAYTITLKDVVNVSRVESAGIIFEIKRYNDARDSNSPGDDSGNIRTLQIKCKNDDDLYEWIDFIYARCPGMGGVSNPTNFSHAVHVGFDPKTGEFVGLPPEWSKLLNSSAITKEDYERNPQAVFEVLEFYSDITKRNDHPEEYSSLMPTPPVTSGANKQLGYTGGGNSVAPPRPQLNNGQRNESYSNVSQTNPTRGQTPPDQAQQIQQMREMAAQYQTNASREEQRRKEQEQQRQREAQAERERERRELEEYNASLPKTRPPLAQQEIGGGYSTSVNVATGSDRYNPTRAAPAAPSASRSQNASPAPLRAQRPAPSAPSNGSRPGAAGQQGSSSQSANGQANQNGRGEPRSDQSQRSDPRQQNGQGGASRAPNGQQTQASKAPGPVAPVKPLNVAKAPSTLPPSANGTQQNDAVKAAEAALVSKTPAERKQDVRMSTMSEAEVMARLKEAVSKDDPSLSYSKQKKIGQGASGSVYVAKVRESAISPIARQVLRDVGPRAQVAIKQMDLAHQPRKELIVNEIMVMKDSKHPNIVNFLDAFLRQNATELWVVMEFMEGGSLTDVIDNNPVITEEQISAICLEVGFHLDCNMEA